MAESKPAISTNDLGVVDPIRIPGAARVRRLWAGLPWLSRAFVVLVVVDVVVRALGLLGTSLFLELTEPLTWVTAFLPHDALILLPALIAYRHPNALVELPLVTRGAIVVALAELLRSPVGNLASGIAGDQLLVPVLVAMAGASGSAVGWVLIARGMRSVTPRKTTDRVKVLAGFVGGGLAMGALLWAAGAVFLGNLDVGDPGSTALLRLSNVVIALGGLGIAYLGWVVIRGTGDPARPPTAETVATTSLVALAIGAVLTWFGGKGPIWLGVYLITYTAAWTGLIVAFGLGLADPSDRAADEEAPEDGPSWPEPDRDPSSWPQPEHRPSR